MIESKKYNYIDFITFFCVFVLLAFSVLAVYTASSSLGYNKHQDSEYFLNLHLIKIVVAIIAMFIGMFTDYKIFLRFTRNILILGIGVLVITIIFQHNIKNTARFIDLGITTFQPSEFVKFILIAHLAKLLSEKSIRVTDFKNGYLPLVVWIVVVALLVFFQPNFSMGSMIVITGFIFIYLGGVRIKHLIITFVPIVPFMIYFLHSANYRKDRIALYINNFERLISLKVNEISNIIDNAVRSGSVADRALGQIWQGILAFGNGGILGAGLGNSRQRDFYLPEAHNDFIFSIIGEEYGFIGTVGIMFLFLILFKRGLKIAKYARDEFGRYLALGITIVITAYAFVNAGVTLGILPTTGLPMPFVSYGGSSIVASSFAIGVLLNISKQTDLYPRISHVPVVGTVNADGN